MIQESDYMRSDCQTVSIPMVETADALVDVTIVNIHASGTISVISVRHTREDPGFLPRLLGRFDTAYDANSMMLYEARWYEQDDNGSSTTPDAADYYYYRSDNKLDKAIYHVTRDGNDNPIDLVAAASSHGAIDDNNATHSDRVIYSRRNTGTRDRICCEAVLRNKAVLRTLVSRQRSARQQPARRV